MQGAPMTPEQEKALREIYDRGPVPHMDKSPLDGQWVRSGRDATFEEFVATSAPAIDGCVMVPWCGMYLGIEKDGYVHS
jgi:hypothetical protein